MKNLFFLNSYLLKYKYNLLGVLLLVVLGNFFSLLPASYIGKATDSIKLILDSFVHQNKLQSKEKNNLLIYGALIILFPIIGGIIKFFMRKILMQISRWVEFDLKKQIYTNYQNLDFITLKKYSNGNLIQYLTEDLFNIRNYLGPGLLLFLNLIVIFSISSIQMLRINLWLSIYSLVPILLTCISIFFFSKRVFKKSQIVQKNRSSLATVIEDIFSGTPIIKSFCLENHFQQKHTHVAKSYQKNCLKLTQAESLLSFIITLLIGISYLSVFYIGGIKYINKEIELGNLTQFLIYINMLSWPLTNFTWVLSIMQKAASSQKRIGFFLIKRNLEDPKKLKKFSFKEKIEVIDLSFSYKKNIEVLKNINFTIKKGQIINLIGNNGSGKSTLTSLMGGLLNYKKGKICIDGQEINEISLRDLRKNISFVSQDNFLFSETIFENISSNHTPKDHSQVRQAAKEAQIERDILKLKMGYHSPIGQRGIGLSGGQKQRICIARAFYKKAPILILDDAFSAIDPKTKKEILSYIKKNPNKQTILLLNPDKSLISYADQTFFI